MIPVADYAGRDWIQTGNPWVGEDLPGIVRSMFPDTLVEGGVRGVSEQGTGLSRSLS